MGGIDRSIIAVIIGFALAPWERAAESSGWRAARLTDGGAVEAIQRSQDVNIACALSGAVLRGVLAFVRHAGGGRASRS